MSKILEKPARKLFLTDLCRCMEVSQETSSSSSTKKEWQTLCAGIKVGFCIVMIQGIIVKVENDGDTLYIDDGTAVAEITGCKVLPFTTVKPCQGHYVMVIGSLLRTGRIPCIRPIKLQNLSHNIILSVVWPLEVIDYLQQCKDELAF